MTPPSSKNIRVFEAYHAENIVKYYDFEASVAKTFVFLKYTMQKTQ